MGKADKVVEWLLSLGATELESSSKKYRKFTSPFGHDKEKGVFAWVGRKGAVRLGRTLKESVSVSSSVNWRMKRKEVK